MATRPDPHRRVFASGGEPGAVRGDGDRRSFADNVCTVSEGGALLAVASQVPSGAIATAITDLAWPVRVRRSAGLGRSGSGHSLISAGSLRLAVSVLAWRPQSGSWPGCTGCRSASAGAR